MPGACKNTDILLYSPYCASSLGKKWLLRLFDERHTLGDRDMPASRPCGSWRFQAYTLLMHNTGPLNKTGSGLLDSLCLQYRGELAISAFCCLIACQACRTVFPLATATAFLLGFVFICQDLKALPLDSSQIGSSPVDISQVRTDRWVIFADHSLHLGGRVQHCLPQVDLVEGRPTQISSL